KLACLVRRRVPQFLSAQKSPAKPLDQTLSEHLKDRELLLVLDNCEHLIAACPGIVHTLLRGAPKDRFLATSRQGLHIRGEQTYHVLPLAAPDRNAGLDSLLRSGDVPLV